MAELDVAEVAVRRLLGAAQRIARDPAAHVLVAHGLRRDCAAAPRLGGARQGELLEDVVLHERQDFVEVLVLVVVRIDVDDQHIVELALDSLLAGMRQQAAGV